MMIQVTGQALPCFNREIIANIRLGTLRMAFLALVLGMNAQKVIARFLAMIKGLGRFPFFRRMAKAAFVLLEFAFVIVDIILHMAFIAGVHEPHITGFIL